MVPTQFKKWFCLNRMLIISMTTIKHLFLSKLTVIVLVSFSTFSHFYPKINMFTDNTTQLEECLENLRKRDINPNEICYKVLEELEKNLERNFKENQSNPPISFQEFLKISTTIILLLIFFVLLKKRRTVKGKNLYCKPYNQYMKYLWWFVSVNCANLVRDNWVVVICRFFFLSGC